MWTSSIPMRPKRRRHPKYSKIHDGFLLPISKVANEFHCRMEHWLTSYNCRAWSNLTRSHWKWLVGILWSPTCTDHHIEGWSDLLHTSTNHMTYPSASTCELGRYLRTLAYLVVYIYLPRMVYSHQDQRLSEMGSLLHRPWSRLFSLSRLAW